MTWSNEHGNRVLAEFMPAIIFSAPFREMRMEESATAGRPLSEARLYRWEPDEVPPSVALLAVVEHMAMSQGGAELILDVSKRLLDEPPKRAVKTPDNAAAYALYVAAAKPEVLFRALVAAVEGVEG